MRHLYYTIQTLLRGHSGTVEKLISLTLGLVMGVLLFAQIAYELSFDRFYPNSDTLVMLRMREVRQGVPEPEYNYGTYRPAAADLSEAFPELVKSSCLTSNFWTPTFYKDDKKLEDLQILFADTAYFQTTGLQLLRGNPNDLTLQGNAFISQRKARERRRAPQQHHATRLVALHVCHGLGLRGRYVGNEQLLWHLVPFEEARRRGCDEQPHTEGRGAIH